MGYKYKRVLLKLSGESLMGNNSYGIAPEKLQTYVKEIKPIVKAGVQLAIVIGGGNIFRGLAGAQKGLDRVQGDHMGMLATCINGLALQSALEKENLQTRLLTSVSMVTIAEPYTKRRAVRHLEKGHIVIFGGGTGNPFFTTDTAATLKAAEIGAEIILKGTRVNGIYNKDPKKNTDAKKYDEITYAKILEKKLRVMDLTAITMSQEHHLPIRVFDMDTPGNLFKIFQGENIGTLVK